jgi:hypothetical protein
MGARWGWGVCGEMEANVGRRQLQVGRGGGKREMSSSRTAASRDHATDLASAALGTAVSASDDVTPYVRERYKWDVLVVCV